MQLRFNNNRRFSRCYNFFPLLECLGEKLSLQEALDLSQNLISESSDAVTNDASDEEILANKFLEFSSDYKEDSQETEQDPGYRILRKKEFLTLGYTALKKYSIEISLKMRNG
ncbi:hypothetical protein TNCV_2004421 [Trichonephila clavipes]|nr:hypothetical protein TNCV_2004421 [Trichonephila clavipes]